jgi:hypothetical protein
VAALLPREAVIPMKDQERYFYIIKPGANPGALKSISDNYYLYSTKTSEYTTNFDKQGGMRVAIIGDIPNDLFETYNDRGRKC